MRVTRMLKSITPHWLQTRTDDPHFLSCPWYSLYEKISRCQQVVTLPSKGGGEEEFPHGLILRLSELGIARNASESPRPRGGRLRICASQSSDRHALFDWTPSWRRSISCNISLTDGLSPSPRKFFAGGRGGQGFTACCEEFFTCISENW